MDSDGLSKLSPEQLAAINEDQKTIFCSMDGKDQDFFARTFTPKELPKVLEKKGAIMLRNQSARLHAAEVQKKMVESASAGPQPDQKIGEILAAAAGVAGIGAAAALVASDNQAFWKGVEPSELIPALRTEFNSSQTQLKVDGSAEALAATVMLYSGGVSVPALTVHLTAANDGTEIKMDDLTSQGTIAAIKEGGQKLLDMAGNAIHVFNHGYGNPEDLLSNASQVLTKGAGLVETAGNLRLKERAWKVIKQSAEAIEKNYLSEQEKARQARFVLEKAWENYNTCPNCGVAFGAEDSECRVCGTARSAKPEQGLAV